MTVPKRELTEIEALDALNRCKRHYPGIAETTYYFIGEWGRMDLTYAQYLFNRKLRNQFIDKSRYTLAVGRRIYSYSVNYLKAHPEVQEVMSYLEQEVQTNPLQFFMPNGSEALAFLNDRSSSLKLLVAGNRFGKTTHGIIDMVLDLIPCDPSWKIFTENGVDYRPWDGLAKQWGVASYMWRHITMTINPLMLQWIPDSFLGDYNSHKKGGVKKVVNAEKRPFVELTNGSALQYFCYQQDTANFESVALNGWLWDEQGMQDKFDGADERTRTKRGGRHIFPLTPHKIKGRPDTGAGTWIHDLWKGEQTKGHRIGRYMACTFDNPDWIYPETEKVKAFIKWVVEPEKHHDMKTLAEGKSRLEGEFHEASGLVYDELVRDIHVIEPFEIPDNWTFYRGIDHGRKHATVCAFAAVTPNNDIIIFDEYYKKNSLVYPNVQAIIEQSGNARVFDERRCDMESNTEFDVFYESQTGREFEWTVLDGRSFKWSESSADRTLGDIYEDAGIQCRAASGGAKIEKVKEALRVDYDKKHLVTGKMGAPKVYIFSNCKMIIKELFAYVWAEEKDTVNGTTDPKPRQKNDDAVNAFEYLVITGPVFIGDYRQNDMDRFYGGYSLESFRNGQVNESDTINNVPTNAITGY